jgi:hypothetical protein
MEDRWTQRSYAAIKDRCERQDAKAQRREEEKAGKKSPVLKNPGPSFEFLRVFVPSRLRVRILIRSKGNSLSLKQELQH